MQEMKVQKACSTTCVFVLVAVILIRLMVIVFYEAAPTSGDLCKIYG